MTVASFPRIEFVSLRDNTKNYKNAQQSHLG